MARRRQRYRTPTTPAGTRARETSAEKLARWKARVAAATALRTEWEQRYRVRELEEMYLGQAQDEGDCEAFLNHFFATIRVQLPGLLYANPSFRVRPKRGQTPFARRDAALMEALLQDLAAQDDNLETDGKLALMQAFFRVGCLKVCYAPGLQTNPQAGDPLVLATLGGVAVPVLDDDGTPVLEPDEILSDELYTWDWVDARRLILPDEGPNMRRWTWIAEEVEVTLEEAQDDARFPQSLRRQFVANARAGQAAGLTTSSAAGTDSTTAADQVAARFRYIECYDTHRHQLYVWADGQPFSDAQFLLDEPTPDGIEDHPYALLAFLPIVGPVPSPWPLPVTYNWLPIQREYNIARAQMTNAGKRSARKVLYDPQTFPDSDEARKALGSSVDMEGVEVNDLNRPPQLFQDGGISPDVSRSTAALQYDWRIVTGAPGTRLSGAADADTATEATLVERAASLRDSEAGAQVATWLGRAGAKMLQLVRQTLTLDTYVQVRGYSDKEFGELLTSPGFQQVLAAQYGPELGPQLPQLLGLFPALQRQLRERYGKEQFLRVSREQLQWEADVTVLPASLRVRTLESEKASWLQFLGLIGQFPQVLMSRGLLEETATRFDFIDENTVDELLLLGQQMAQQAAQQPPRGGSRPAPVAHGQLPPGARSVL